MAKYKAYPEYKDSGVEWLGRVPNEWSIKSLKNIVIIINGSTPKSGVEEYWDGDINWITPTDLSQKSGVYLNDSQRKITNKGLDSCGTSLVPENTVILSTRAPIGSLAITGTQSCTNQGCKSLVVKNKDSSLYLYYYLSISTSLLNNLGRGSTFLELSTEDLATFKVPMPNVGIGTIVSFLEHETAKIDNLIEKQQQMIELLKEKCQAVISHAVTKGLNPDVPMKDSGVEWLGEVPEHWTISRYKFCTSRIIVGIAEAATHAYSDSGIPIIRSTNIKENGLNTADLLYLKNEFARQNESKYLFSNDIVTVRTGYPGISAVIPEILNGSHCFTNLVSTPLHNQHSKYLAEYLNSAMGKEYFALNGWGSAQKNISVPILQNFPIAYPDSDEQREISEFVINIRDEFSNLLEKVDESIRLMQERRTALISAAVTGKIDVRDWVAPDAQDIEEPQEATA